MRAPLVLAAMVGAFLLAPAPAWGVTLGFSDDALIRTPEGTTALLDAAQANRARLVRTIVRPNNLERFVGLAQGARARGMTLHATIDFAFGHGGEMPVREYSEYVRDVAGALAATGVHLRLGVVNEPDLIFRVSGSCEPGQVVRVLESAGHKVSLRDVTSRVRRYRTVRMKIRSKSGKRRWVTRRVAVTRRVKTVRRVRGKRRVSYRRVAVYDLRTVQTEVVTTTTSSDEVVELTPRRACVTVLRARAASPYLIAGIAAVRASAPNAEIVVGDTSSTPGYDIFIREVVRLGLPRIDGWAHHPYDMNVAAIRAVVSEELGGVPLDLTEFGVHRREGAAAGASGWMSVGRQACELGVRSVVAYQVQSEQPDPWDKTPLWDTSLLDPGFAASPQSRAFTGIAC